MMDLLSTSTALTAAAAMDLPASDPRGAADDGTDGTGGSDTATLPAPPRQSTKPKPKRPPRKHLPQWRVLLHNDDVNDMLFVVETILMLTPLNQQMAMVCMLEAHKSGTALLLTTHREHAELLHEQFTSRQLTVTIEPEA